MQTETGEVFVVISTQSDDNLSCFPSVLPHNLPLLPAALQLLAFLQGLFTFYHEGYELATEFEPYKQQLQFNLQNVSLIDQWIINTQSALWSVFLFEPLQDVGSHFCINGAAHTLLLRTRNGNSLSIIN